MGGKKQKHDKDSIGECIKPGRREGLQETVCKQGQSFIGYEETWWSFVKDEELGVDTKGWKQSDG